MPEATAESGSSRELHFVDRLPEHPGEALCIDLGDESGAFPLATLYRRHEVEWKQAFVAWLGKANVENASLAWWAHTTSAKNFLSTPLGNQAFQALALAQALRATPDRQTYVAGATSGQVDAIAAWASVEGTGWHVRDRRNRLALPRFTLLRLAYHCARVVGAFLLLRPKRRFLTTARVCLFTYVDAGFRDGADAFFGRLAAGLRDRSGRPPLHVAFVHSAYRSTLPKLESATDFEYWPIYGELHAADVLWAAARTIAAMSRVSRWRFPARLGELDIAALAREGLRWDLAKGGYFYNLLVFRAARRLAARLLPERIVYPFENKALEKMLLLGCRATAPACRLIGYQHTSITPRHTTFLFADGEAGVTPLPDQIITVGAVTYRYLAEHGNYPAGLLVPGCALRQVWREPFPRRSCTGRRLRVLLALSSSRSELRDAVRLVRNVGLHGLECEWGIRPHPEFPLHTLPDAEGNWVRTQARDFSATALHENIDWCDATVYVSSTVALEALMLGRPVINVRLADPIDPDPALGAPPFHFRVGDAAELATTLRAVAALSEESYAAQSRAAVAYVRDYLAPFADGSERLFLE